MTAQAKSQEKSNVAVLKETAKVAKPLSVKERDAAIVKEKEALEKDGKVTVAVSPVSGCLVLTK